MWATGFPELTIKRRLKTLQREGWLFVFGDAEGQQTLYVVDPRKLAACILSANPTRSLLDWAEKALGILQLPTPQRAREAKYR